MGGAKVPAIHDGVNHDRGNHSVGLDAVLATMTQASRTRPGAIKVTAHGGHATTLLKVSVENSIKFDHLGYGGVRMLT